jgi:hypothetical protein
MTRGQLDRTIPQPWQLYCRVPGPMVPTESVVICASWLLPKLTNVPGARLTIATLRMTVFLEATTSHPASLSRIATRSDGISLIVESVTLGLMEPQDKHPVPMPTLPC